ncbi:MAG TPA: DUF3558 family protein [Pseudonocardiaceae bacterium]
MLSVIAAAILAACAGGGGGVLQPSGISATKSGAASTTSASSGGGVSDRWFNSVQACSMIDQATLTQLGFTSPGTVVTNNDYENRCDWKQENAGISIDMTPNAWDTLSANGGQLSNLTVGGRSAQQDDLSSQHSCIVAVEATKGSQAMIVVDVLPASGLNPCDIAQQAAAGAVSKLPKLPS